MNLDANLLFSLADKVGTPYWLYDGTVIRRRIADVSFMTDTEGVQARFAMKACSATKLLREMRAARVWIDAVSGNEAMRAMRVGYAPGHEPPEILFTCDVFRDNALSVVLENRLLPNLGSGGMLRELENAKYRGPVSLRVNPGFGHGHVNACDTGGPSSKHGIWFEDLQAAAVSAERSGMEVAMLHAHIGSGPKYLEFQQNLSLLSERLAEILPLFSNVRAVSLGGGIPHNYVDSKAQPPLEPLRALFSGCRAQLSTAANRPLRLEIEPGRYYSAPGCALIARVSELKSTRSNKYGSGVAFAMVDAGMADLVRPVLYGSYHRIEIIAQDRAERPWDEIVVAGPLSESDDVFTQDQSKLLRPRRLPRPEPGDLIAVCDAGAYGYSMSSNYNSYGRPPQIWIEEDGAVEMISRRETLDDALHTELSERIV